MGGSNTKIWISNIDVRGAFASAMADELDLIPNKT